MDRFTIKITSVHDPPPFVWHDMFRVSFRLVIEAIERAKLFCQQHIIVQNYDNDMRVGVFQSEGTPLYDINDVIVMYVPERCICCHIRQCECATVVSPKRYINIQAYGTLEEQHNFLRKSNVEYKPAPAPVVCCLSPESECLNTHDGKIIYNRPVQSDTSELDKWKQEHTYEQTDGTQQYKYSPGLLRIHQMQKFYFQKK